MLFMVMQATMSLRAVQVMTTLMVMQATMYLKVAPETIP